MEASLYSIQYIHEQHAHGSNQPACSNDMYVYTYLTVYLTLPTGTYLPTYLGN